MKILVVEDDRDLVDFLAFILGEQGYEVLRAYDLPTARNLLAVGQPDLVVLDLVLGPQDGLDLLRELPPCDDMPVIVLSARYDIVDQPAGFARGASAFLGKPFSYHELIALIRTQLAPRRTSGMLPMPPLAGSQLALRFR